MCFLFRFCSTFQDVRKRLRVVYESSGPSTGLQFDETLNFGILRVTVLVIQISDEVLPQYRDSGSIHSQCHGFVGGLSSQKSNVELIGSLVI